MTPDRYLEILDAEADDIEATAQKRMDLLRESEENFLRLVTGDNAYGNYLPSEEVDIQAVAREYWRLYHELRTQVYMDEREAMKFRLIAKSNTLKIARRINKIQERFKK